MSLRWLVQSLLLTVLLSVPGASVSWAQAAKDVKLSPVEVGAGVTVNAIFMDPNAVPNCFNLSLPCTHASPRSFGGYGLTASVAGNLTDKLAIAAEAATFTVGWDSAASVATHRSETDLVTTALVGARVSTGFFYPGNHDPSPGRFFAQFLVGGEGSGAVPLRPAFCIGAGADVLMRARGAYMRGEARHAAFRLALDYELSPGPGRNLSGWRAVFGFVLGPKVV